MKRKRVKPSRATRTLPGTSFSFPSSSFSCILETFPTWAKIFSKPRCHVLCCPPEKGINLWKYFFCPRRPLDGEKFLPLVHSAVLASSPATQWHRDIFGRQVFSCRLIHFVEMAFLVGRSCTLWTTRPWSDGAHFRSSTISTSHCPAQPQAQSSCNF